VAAIATMAGLHRARRDGVGCDCDISLFETALAELMYVGTWTATHAYTPPRWDNSAHPSLVPFQNFRTSDGWIVVACAKEKFWRRLCEGIGLPELATDPSFATFADRGHNRSDLLEILDSTFLERTTDDWVDVLSEAGVPVSPVNDVKAALEDPQVIARDSVVEFPHPILGTVRQIATPLRVGDEEKPVHRAPFLGEHTGEVLAGVCGYSPERVASLMENGVAVGHPRPAPSVDGAVPSAAADVAAVQAQGPPGRQ
jgi:crotonobetainyl-CoA:carnitine CoA-transferase CaiB-like acyl-CoA transferase